MREIVVRVTPSKIKLLISLLMIIGLGYYTYFYYGQYNEYYTKYNDLLINGAAQVTATATAPKEAANETANGSAEEAAVPAANEEAAVETGPKEKALSGTLEVILEEPRYEIKESGDTKKAVFSSLEFTVINGLSTDQTLLVEIHAYDVGETDENKILARKGGDRVLLPTIASGERLTKSIIFPSNQRINLYNLDTAKIIHLDLLDNAAFEDSRERKVLATAKKTIIFS